MELEQNIVQHIKELAQQTEELDAELTDIDKVPESAPPTLDEWKKESPFIHRYLTYREGLGHEFDEQMEKMDARLEGIDEVKALRAYTTFADHDALFEEHEDPVFRGWLDGESKEPLKPRYDAQSLHEALAQTQY